MSGMFEFLAASPDEEQVAQREAADKLAAAVYDVREQFGDFLFKAASIDEFRTRVHLVKPDMMKVVDRHLMPVSGVMGKIATRRDSILEKEFRARQAKTAGDSTEVSKIPECDICKYEHGKSGVPASVDGKTKMGPWANMCGDHFKSHGVGLGTGRGQQLRQRQSADYTHHGPKNVQVKAKDPEGREWDGVFGSPDRAQEWAEGRESGDPYDPIPKGRDSIAFAKGAPFADYNDFADCTSKNADKEDPDAYCGKIKHQVEGSREIVASSPHLGWFSMDAGEHQACYPGCDENEAHAAKYHNKDKEARRYQATGDEPPRRPTRGDEPNPHNLPIDVSGWPDEQKRELWHEFRGNEPYPGHHVWGRTATGDGPALDTDETYRPSGGPLIPEGNFDGYLDSVDQGAPAKAENNFAPGEHDKTYTHDNSNFVSGRESASHYMEFQDPVQQDYFNGDWRDDPNDPRQAKPRPADSPGLGGPGKGTHSGPVGISVDPDTIKDRQARQLVPRYLVFCRRNGLPPTLAALERHGQMLTPAEYLRIASALTQLAQLPPKRQAKIANLVNIIAFRTAAPDFLQKAKDALEGLLNQKAEVFQESVAPLQQAYQVIQQAQAAEMAASPLNVQPPAGTVNVLPGAPGALPGDPASGGLPPGDPSAPPPAAAAADAAGGAPPMDPTQMMAASRERGGHPKDQRRQGAGVVDKYHDWLNKQPAKPGGQVPIDEFTQEFGVGERGRKKLDSEFGVTRPTAGVITMGKVSGLTEALLEKTSWMGWGPDPKNHHHKSAGWDWNDRLSAYEAKAPGRFACSCGNEMDMPGHHTCKCGKIWNGYVIGTGGRNHAAAAEKYLVREIPVRPGVIVAGKHSLDDAEPHVSPYTGKEDQPKLRSKNPLGWDEGFNHSEPFWPDRAASLASDRAWWKKVAEEEGSSDFPSNHHPKTDRTPATPDDWAHRDEQNNWTKHPVPRRKKRQPA